MNTIFNYNCYRVFLRDHLESPISKDKKISCSSWSKILGLGSTSSLSRVISGDRAPGPEISKKLIQYFNFTEDEQQYFEYLILLDKSEEGSELKKLTQEKLKELKPFSKTKQIATSQLSLISDWFAPAIIQMTEFPEFNEDPKWIQDRLVFHVNTEEIKDCLDKWEKIGFLRRDNKGKISCSFDHFFTSVDNSEGDIKNNHLQNIQNAKKALSNIPVEHREFGSAYINIKRDRLKEVKEHLIKVRSDFDKKFNDKDGNQTVIFQFQCYPLTN